jgi:predicted NUDIX family phosphoesterase
MGEQSPPLGTSRRIAMAAVKAREKVLVIPESRFEAAGAFIGFRAFDADYLQTLLDPKFLSYRPRGEVETDPSFKQLIPYIVLCCRGEVFHYTRGRSGTETRLQSLRSIGVGGHINYEDGPPGGDPYRTGMQRELAEELNIESAYREECFGFIYDPSTPVGQVHLGVVHRLELEKPLAQPRELAIDDAGFAPIAELLRQRNQFETWSQLALEMLKFDNWA